MRRKMAGQEEIWGRWRRLEISPAENEREPGGEGLARIHKYESVVLSLCEASCRPVWEIEFSDLSPQMPSSPYLPISFSPPPTQRGSPLRNIPHLALGWTVSAATTLFELLAWTPTLKPDESCRNAAPIISLHSWLPNDVCCPQPSLASSLQQATFTALPSRSPSAYPNLDHAEYFLFPRYACVSLPWNLHSRCLLSLDWNALPTHSPLHSEVLSTIQDQALVKTYMIPWTSSIPELDIAFPFHGSLLIFLFPLHKSFNELIGSRDTALYRVGTQQGFVTLSYNTLMTLNLGREAMSNRTSRRLFFNQYGNNWWAYELYSLKRVAFFMHMLHFCGKLYRT